jgi:cytochrome b subunit of formate dehydrogenase
LNILARSLALVAAALLSFAVHAADAPTPATTTCLGCHDGSKPLAAKAADGAKRTLRALAPEALKGGVHASMQCADCHQDVVDNEAPHRKTAAAAPDCLGCHQGLIERAKQQGRAAAPGLQLVIDQAERYQQSVHSRPNADDKTQKNASCSGCHDSHTFARLPEGSPQQAARRLALPQLCGTCHEDHIEEYSTSIHGVTVLEKRDPKSAICSDCHNPHGIDRTNAVPAKLGMVKACAACHKENGASYADTYHGQVADLGYAHTAMCFNCHGSHDIRSPDDPKSSVHPDNRLETCRECHKEASANFASFQPHGNAHDFKRYPQIWLTTKFMVGLLAGTFGFFWLHLILWLYRESRDRAEGKSRPHVRVDQLGLPPGKQVRRFGPWWRLGHLLFAVSLMILTLTGMTLMYADSAWAPVVMKLLGGPKIAAIVHRVNAVVFAGVFVVHIVYMALHIGRRWRTFKWFGPDSLIPNLQDLKDVIAMFNWFLGRGPRPVFDRWTYWEKFDYWAPFWGVAIVGVSGFLMWFPHVTSAFLPGWVFNVAAITHGEEAFLAAVFLFTVHFFNNHFRPDKFPFDPVMFTGSVPLEHFAREHTVQYRRMVDSGELARHLVDAPSRPMAIGSRVLGFVLISFGLLLLALIINGFTRSMLA